MRAIQVSSYVSSPSDLRISTVPTPTPSPDKYLVEIRACGTNFFDLLQIRGRYQNQPPLPWISGAEFAGTVICGPTSTSSSSERSSPARFQPGDRVFGASQGAYATHILVPESALHPIPPGWSYSDAAGLHLTAPTAYAALVTRTHTQAGDWVLIHAGAGGVGLSAVQVAKALGATVIATVGTERKRRVCLDYGADHAIVYSSSNSDWPQQVTALCQAHRTGNGQQGVDVVFDPVGLIGPSLRCVAWNARLLVIGFAAGEIEKLALNRVLLKNVSVAGLHWGLYASRETETVEEVWRGIFDLIGQGKFKGIAFTDQLFNGLESVPTALEMLARRETWGKVVVRLTEEQGEGPKDEPGRESKL